MDEVELIRNFRSEAARSDADAEQAARTALLDAIDNESRSAGSRWRIWRSKRSVRRLLAIALAAAVLPGGYAIAQLTSSEVRDESGAPASVSCPKADAAFEQAGVPAATEYAHRCPSPEEIEDLISTLGGDAERVRSLDR